MAAPPPLAGFDIEQQGPEHDSTALMEVDGTTLVACRGAWGAYGDLLCC